MTTLTGINKTYFSVQALRALAALMVVSQHAAERWHIWIAHQADKPIGWLNGQAGVDIFFVISGFVMMVSLPGLAGKANKGWLFLRRRFVRIVPLYWFFTTLTLLKLHLGLSAAHETTGSSWHVVASYLFIPSLNAQHTPVPILTAGWTLQYEMMFYLLFAIPLTLKVAPLAFLVPILSVVAAVGWFNNPSWPGFLQGWVSPVVLEFLFGAVLGHLALQRRLPSRAVGTVLLMGGLAAIFTLPIGIAGRVVYWGVPAAAIVTGAASLEDHLAPRLPKWLLELGNSSYSIYLVHLFVLPFMWVIVQRIGATGVTALVEILAASLVACAAVGVAVHRLLELPLTNFFRGKRVSDVSTLPA